MYNYVVDTKYGKVQLGKWIVTQRSRYKEGSLNSRKIEKLNNIKI